MTQPCQPYLMVLNSRLRDQCAQWDQSRLDLHAKFILGRMECEPDGNDESCGFRGRAGKKDLYYTAFALRALALCRDAIDNKILKSCANFALSCPAPNAIELVSKLFCLWLCCGRVDDHIKSDAAELLQKLYRPDGGYAKSATAQQSSMYHSFLAMLCWDMLCENPPNADKTIEFVRKRQCDDGGFAEGTNLSFGSVNPTAAALAVMVSSGIITGSEIDRAVEFLLKMQDKAGGGFFAAPQVPVADLLSSFTATLTLADLGMLDNGQMGKLCEFLRNCRQPSGGFGAWADDNTADCEYSFYGLGLAAILGDEQLV